jgi:hypothetical protein
MRDDDSKTIREHYGRSNFKDLVRYLVRESFNRGVLEREYEEILRNVKESGVITL